MEADRWRQHSGKAMQHSGGEQRLAGFGDRRCAERVEPFFPKCLLGGDLPPQGRPLDKASHADPWEDMEGVGSRDRMCAMRVEPIFPKCLLGGDPPPHGRPLGKASHADPWEDMEEIGSKPLDDLILDCRVWLDCSLDVSCTSRLRP